MRFQVPALAIGLFASLALSQSDSLKVRIETLFDGPGDDATSICALQLSGVCKSGAPTTTEKFATFNEESGLCESQSSSFLNVNQTDAYSEANLSLNS